MFPEYLEHVTKYNEEQYLLCEIAGDDIHGQCVLNHVGIGEWT